MSRFSRTRSSTCLERRASLTVARRDAPVWLYHRLRCDAPSLRMAVAALDSQGGGLFGFNAPSVVGEKPLTHRRELTYISVRLLRARRIPLLSTYRQPIIEMFSSEIEAVLEGRIHDALCSAATGFRRGCIRATNAHLHLPVYRQRENWIIDIYECRHHCNVTTVGNTANLYAINAGSVIRNDSSSISISGIGTFQFISPSQVSNVVTNPALVGQSTVSLTDLAGNVFVWVFDTSTPRVNGTCSRLSDHLL